jgi:endoglucanase
MVARLLLFPAALFMGQAALAETPVERHDQLRGVGDRIVDQRGDPVVLRGMSLFWSQ